MPPTSVDKVFESMMMQMLNPNQNAANVVCCNCFKVKKKESQRSSNSSRKCQKSSAPEKHKKRHRKLKKSCLKTIICITKMTKDVEEGQGCSCDPCCGNMGQDVDERFCSKCGQLRPGMAAADQPLNQPDQQCREQLQRCQQEYKDMAVQANVDRKEPLSVRIRVCPCPNVNIRSPDEKLYQSVSLPELSSTNPRLVDGASSGNVFSSTAPHTRYEDSNYEESRQSQLPAKRTNETTPEWPADMASIKKLALNMAKARLVEEAACWEREYARRYLQQERQREMEEQAEQHADEQPDVAQRKSVKTDGSLEVKRRSFVPFEEGQGQTAPSTSGFKTQMGTRTQPNYNQPYTMDLCNEYSSATYFGASYIPRQSMAGGCCPGTDVYCYSPESGPSPFGNHCEHACTCVNTRQFQPYQYPGQYSGYQYQSIPHQQEFGIQQDRSRPDPYEMSCGSLGNFHPCR